MQIGQTVRCVSPVEPLLYRGKLYTVAEKVNGLYGMRECPGALFGDWRFKPAKATAPRGAAKE